MNIRILEFIEGAKQATGLTVIIDVFRAFSVGCYVANNGAGRIIAAGSVDTARQLRQENPDSILIGERNERKVEGFDYGNSPVEVSGLDARSSDAHRQSRTEAGGQRVPGGLWRQR